MNGYIHMVNNYFMQWETYVVGDLVSGFYFLLLYDTLTPIIFFFFLVFNVFPFKKKNLETMSLIYSSIGRNIFDFVKY